MTKCHIADDECKNLECDGFYIIDSVENCTCFLNAPCAACETSPLICEKCKKEAYEE